MVRIVSFDLGIELVLAFRCCSKDDIKTFVREKMKLVVTGMAYGGYKGTFGSATEVKKTSRFCYAYETVKGGDYWFVMMGEMTRGMTTWHRYYDYKLKGWIVG